MTFSARVPFRALLLAALLLCSAAATTAAAAPAVPFGVESVPNVHLKDKRLYLSDPDSLISTTAAAGINRAAAALEQSRGVETAVVVLKNVGDNDGRLFATDLFQHWGLGKKGKDNGLLILLITEPPERSIIFETGYGLEGVLPDAVCYRLQQRYMMPDFRNNDFSAGLLKGVEAVAAYLGADAPGRAAMAPPQAEEQEDDAASVIVTLLLIVLFLYFARRNPRAAMAILGSIGRGPRGGGGFGGGGGRGGGGSWGGGSSGGGGARSRF